MTSTEQRRLIVLNHLSAGTRTNAQAAEILSMSVRQIQRLNTEPIARPAAAAFGRSTLSSRATMHAD